MKNRSKLVTESSVIIRKDVIEPRRGDFRSNQAYYQARIKYWFSLNYTAGLFPLQFLRFSTPIAFSLVSKLIASFVRPGLDIDRLAPAEKEAYEKIKALLCDQIVPTGRHGQQGATYELCEKQNTVIDVINQYRPGWETTAKGVENLTAVVNQMIQEFHQQMESQSNFALPVAIGVGLALMGVLAVYVVYRSMQDRQAKKLEEGVKRTKVYHQLAIHNQLLDKNKVELELYREKSRADGQLISSDALDQPRYHQTKDVEDYRDTLQGELTPNLTRLAWRPPIVTMANIAVNELTLFLHSQGREQTIGGVLRDKNSPFVEEDYENTPVALKRIAYRLSDGELNKWIPRVYKTSYAASAFTELEEGKKGYEALQKSLPFNYGQKLREELDDVCSADPEKMAQCLNLIMNDRKLKNFPTSYWRQFFAGFFNARPGAPTPGFANNEVGQSARERHSQANARHDHMYHSGISTLAALPMKDRLKILLVLNNAPSGEGNEPDAIRKHYSTLSENLMVGINSKRHKEKFTSADWTTKKPYERFAVQAYPFYLGVLQVPLAFILWPIASEVLELDIMWAGVAAFAITTVCWAIETYFYEIVAGLTRQPSTDQKIVDTILSKPLRELPMGTTSSQLENDLVEAIAKYRETKERNYIQIDDNEEEANEQKQANHKQDEETLDNILVKAAAWGEHRDPADRFDVLYRLIFEQAKIPFKTITKYDGLKLANFLRIFISKDTRRDQFLNWYWGKETPEGWPSITNDLRVKIYQACRDYGEGLDVKPVVQTPQVLAQPQTAASQGSRSSEEEKPSGRPNEAKGEDGQGEAVAASAVREGRGAGAGAGSSGTGLGQSVVTTELQAEATPEPLSQWLLGRDVLRLELQQSVNTVFKGDAKLDYKKQRGQTERTSVQVEFGKLKGFFSGNEEQQTYVVRQLGQFTAMTMTAPQSTTNPVSDSAAISGTVPEQSVVYTDGLSVFAVPILNALQAAKTKDATKVWSQYLVAAGKQFDKAATREGRTNLGVYQVKTRTFATEMVNALSIAWDHGKLKLNVMEQALESIAKQFVAAKENAYLELQSDSSQLPHPSSDSHTLLKLLVDFVQEGARASNRKMVTDYLKEKLKPTKSHTIGQSVNSLFEPMSHKGQERSQGTFGALTLSAAIASRFTLDWRDAKLEDKKVLVGLLIDSTKGQFATKSGKLPQWVKDFQFINKDSMVVGAGITRRPRDDFYSTFFNSLVDVTQRQESWKAPVANTQSLYQLYKFAVTFGAEKESPEEQGQFVVRAQALAEPRMGERSDGSRNRELKAGGAALFLGLYETAVNHNDKASAACLMGTLLQDTKILVQPANKAAINHGLMKLHFKNVQEQAEFVARVLAMPGQYGLTPVAQRVLHQAIFDNAVAANNTELAGAAAARWLEFESGLLTRETLTRPDMDRAQASIYQGLHRVLQTKDAVANEELASLVHGCKAVVGADTSHNEESKAGAESKGEGASISIPQTQQMLMTIGVLAQYESVSLAKRIRKEFAEGGVRERIADLYHNKVFDAINEYVYNENNEATRGLLEPDSRSLTDKLEALGVSFISKAQVPIKSETRLWQEMCAQWSAPQLQQIQRAVQANPARPSAGAAISTTSPLQNIRVDGVSDESLTSSVEEKPASQRRAASRQGRPSVMQSIAGFFGCSKRGKKSSTQQAGVEVQDWVTGSRVEANGRDRSDTVASRVSRAASVAGLSRSMQQPLLSGEQEQKPTGYGSGQLFLRTDDQNSGSTNSRRGSAADSIETASNGPNSGVIHALTEEDSADTIDSVTSNRSLGR